MSDASARAQAVHSMVGARSRKTSGKALHEEQVAWFVPGLRGRSPVILMVAEPQPVCVGARHHLLAWRCLNRYRAARAARVQVRASGDLRRNDVTRSGESGNLSLGAGPKPSGTGWAGNVSYITYTGSSMNPTLRRPDLLEVAPYAGRPIRVGDVVLFESPDTHDYVVHRVVRMTPQGIRTRGDNSENDDPYTLGPGNVLGRVAWAWRGQHRRTIAGGRLGRAVGYWAGWQLAIDRMGDRLLYPLTGLLARRGALRFLMPAGLTPRVVVFETDGSESWRILFGATVIGQYDFRLNRWCVKWPFRPLVDESSLPRPNQ